MNPKYHLLAALAAMSLGACTKDDTVTEPEKGGYKIAFTVAEDSETRTTLSETDVLQWVPTDKVGIYTAKPNGQNGQNGQNTNANILTVADVNQSPVEFIGVLENLVSKGDMFYAYYPYNAEQSTDPARARLTIPTEQTQREVGVYNGQSQPLAAVPMAITWEHDSFAGRINSARFRLLGAIVELQIFSSDEALHSEKIQSVKFESETPLAGDFTFDLTGVKDKEDLPISGCELTEVTTTLAEPAAIPAPPATKEEVAARVYLTIAPGTYTGRIVVETDFARYTFSLTEPMTFERAMIKGLPADLAGATREITDLDATIDFADPEVKRICVKNRIWDTNGDKELSYGEAAAVTNIGVQFYGESISSFNELRYFTGLKSIEDYAFVDCSSLTSITIPNGVTAIGQSAFEFCNSLTSIQLPDGVTSIGMAAFFDCSSLTSINIPQTVSSIGDAAFIGCTSLSAFYGKYASTDNRCLIMDGTLLVFAPADFDEYRIPDGVTSIGDYAFGGCSSLTSIQLPDGVTTIGDSAFEGCSSLTSIQLPDGVTTIGDYAFYDCSSLTSIHLPDGVTSIGVEAFVGCSSLTSINIPLTVSSIGEGVFACCSSLSAFYGKYASADQRCLIRDAMLLAFAPANKPEYTIPDEVTTIGKFVFYDCSNLTSINIPGGVTAIGDNAFRKCSSLTSVNIPNGVTSIGIYAFSGCGSLTSINIPDGVTAIEDSAFEYCSSLTSITIPDGVTSIGGSAFESCSNLTSVYCKPTTPPTLGAWVFSDTSPSMKIYVPKDSFETYRTDGGWSEYESQIVEDNTPTQE